MSSLRLTRVLTSAAATALVCSAAVVSTSSATVLNPQPLPPRQVPTTIFLNPQPLPPLVF
jgi:hypothetical protein